ncbi:hypothetical protein ACFQ5N_02190 [Lutibacter holmesii]|uniref:DUF3168 domain-containing protein n=1 Tax=Lutibacter holmesii TaxID=1137985 RepID=A0ABW3WJM8_9FLAO
MFEISKIIYQLLNSVQLLSDKNIDPQPIISAQSDDYPLVNYAISEGTTYSKENQLQYTASVRIYTDDDYDEALQIADAILEAFKDSAIRFKYNGTQEPQVDAYGQYYTESNYSFKK